MVNAQEWLDKNYPLEERKNVRELDLTNLNLEGDLDLKDFRYDLKVYITGNPQLGEIKNKSLGAKIYIDAQEWLNLKYPNEKEVEKIENRDRMLFGELIIVDFPQLKEITLYNINGGNLTQLRIINCPQLTELDCINNNLTELIIVNCSNLQKINAYKNQLTSLDLTNQQQLEELQIGHNNFSSDLSFLSHLVNLKELKLRNNHFTGSLKPLRNLNKLELLDISETVISHGLEYLPESIERFECSFTQRPQSQVGDIWEELQGFEKIKSKTNESWNDGGLKKWREAKMDKKLFLTISPLLPPQLISKLKKGNKFRENYGIPNTNYQEIHFDLWKDKENKKTLLVKELPTKLCNIKKGEMELTENNSDIKNYAIISYVWGEQKETADNVWNRFQYWNKGLNVPGNKALYKATETCKLLDINHFWIDQLCIDQNNPTEKAQEVSKMRQYYSNADYTLISINTELGDISNIDLMDILKTIVRSEWFSRSWTFQEGWLSKHTIFMFDDKLIDGRAMAGTWALNQVSYVDGGKYESRSQFQKGTKKIATPVGWVYYRNGYDENDKVTLTLSQALKEVKKRGRSVPIDGIYSILGLLPYGEHVGVKYNSNNKYTKEELNQVLYEVMKVAVGYRKRIEPAHYNKPWNKSIKETLSSGEKVIEWWEEEGYGEPLAWYGKSNSTSGFCWMPEIYEDGSTSVEGGLEVRSKNDFSMVCNNGIFLEKGIKLDHTKYIIQKTNSTIQKLEGGFEIEGGLYQKEVEAKGRLYDNEKRDYKDVVTKMSLLGTQATLEEVKEDKILLLPERRSWKSKKHFALLVEDIGKESEADRYGVKYKVYHRLGLVEISNGERLEEGKGVAVIIGSKLQEQSPLQTQIEIPLQNQIEQLPK